MCLNENCSNVQAGKHVGFIFYLEWSEIMRCFNTAFQLHFVTVIIKLRENGTEGSI
jgi:hypothetical protein